MLRNQETKIVDPVKDAGTCIVALWCRQVQQTTLTLLRQSTFISSRDTRNTSPQEKVADSTNAPLMKWSSSSQCLRPSTAQI